MSDSRRLAIPGPRDVRATLDRPESPEGAVVACPPHPRMGGDRRDPRLRAVSRALCDRGVACLRVDYGPWDEGRGERRDARAGLDWCRQRYDAVGLVGYSFGAGVALCGAADAHEAGERVAAVSALAPPAASGEDPTPDCLARVGVPCQVVYGERDATVDWAPVVDRAREAEMAVTGVEAGHGFAGRTEAVAAAVAEFLTPRC